MNINKILVNKRYNTFLDFSNKNISCLNLDGHYYLEYLNCSYNQITQIDNLPDKLKYLNCSYNQIGGFVNFPDQYINSLEEIN